MEKLVFKRWHDLLNMPKRDKMWHIKDIAAEHQELQDAEGWINRWSEYSDVAYSVTRGRWSGHDIESPLNRREFYYGSIYMFPKYTLRYMFYRRAGKKLGARRPLHEVRNPKKLNKLHHIAKEYDLDPHEFAALCEKRLRYWPLLK